MGCDLDCCDGLNADGTCPCGYGASCCGEIPGQMTVDECIEIACLPAQEDRSRVEAS
jgi:hypothetical protein